MLCVAAERRLWFVVLSYVVHFNAVCFLPGRESSGERAVALLGFFALLEIRARFRRTQPQTKLVNARMH